MSFGLKNVNATYQKVMVLLFHDMMPQEVEVYIDDILAKLKKEKDRMQVLRRLFERLQKYQLRLNPAKCLFRVNVTPSRRSGNPRLISWSFVY
jgi:predicted MPP superfamily phosphohydrolase